MLKFESPTDPNNPNTPHPSDLLERPDPADESLEKSLEAQFDIDEDGYAVKEDR